MNPPVEAETIYEAYPRKVGRPIAMRAIVKALKKVPFEKLLELTKQYAAIRKSEDPNFTPHPATWFNQERWSDDPSTWGRQHSQISQPNRRNAGVVAAPTTYTNTKPRLQREREAREAAALDQTLAAAGPAPLSTQGGGQHPV